MALIVYTKFGESDAGVMPDSQKDAYYAFFRDLGRLFTCCLNMMERKPFLVSICYAGELQDVWGMDAFRQLITFALGGSYRYGRP